MLGAYPFKDCAISEDSCSITIDKMNKNCLVLTNYQLFVSFCPLNQTHLCLCLIHSFFIIFDSCPNALSTLRIIPIRINNINHPIFQILNNLPMRPKITPNLQIIIFPVNGGSFFQTNSKCLFPNTYNSFILKVDIFMYKSIDVKLWCMLCENINIIF
jgi:hypothetical protein